MNQKELVRELKEMQAKNEMLLTAILEQLKILAEKGVAVSGVAPTIVRTSQSTPQTTSVIEIEEDVVVTKVDTSDMEKGFDSITETKSEKDEGVSSAVNKLAALKNRN